MLQVRKFGNSRGSSLLVSMLFMIAVAFALTLVGFGLEKLMPLDPAAADASIAAEFIFPGALHPKPHDRILFPLVVIGGLLVILGAAALWHRFVQRPLDFRIAFLAVVLLSVAVLLWMGFGDSFLWLFQAANLTGTIVCFAIALALAAFSVWYPLQRGGWVIFCCTATAALTVATRIFSSVMVNYKPQLTSHFEAAIYSMVHIAGGGTCLADAQTQYGCYGEFLAPVLRLTGASTLAITLVFAVLQIIATTAIIVFASRMIKNSGLLLAAVLCILMTNYAVYFVGNSDPYFQYNPIRLLFPALCLLWALRLEKSMSPVNLILTGVLAGISLAWNLDTGVAVSAALACFVLIHHLDASGDRPVWQRISIALGYFVLGAIIFLAAFFLYLELKSGWTVDVLRAFAYQRAFYVAGLAMMPMPAFPNYWTLVAVITGAVFLTTFVSAFRHELTIQSKRAAMLAVLAIGLLLYYTGRSHWAVLRFVLWPDIILFFFVTDQFLRATQSRLLRTAFVSVGIALPIAICVVHYPLLVRAVSLVHAELPDAKEVQQDIAFIRSLAARGETIGILAENQATLHGETETWPGVAGPSIAELQRFADREVIKDSIVKHGPDKVFVTTSSRSLGFDSKSLDLSGYTLAATAPEGRLLYYKKK